MLRKNFITLVAAVATMSRFLLLTGVILLMADHSLAQDYSPDRTPMQCQLIKQAVAQYGFAAARRHALERQMFHETDKGEALAQISDRL